jgi:hypothetical protein
MTPRAPNPRQNRSGAPVSVSGKIDCIPSISISTYRGQGGL